MSQSVQAAHGAITLSVIDGTPTTFSSEVAQHFGKAHDDVLRKIRTLTADTPADFNARNFAAVETTDAKGEKRPAYRLTRDGFTLLAMGFTGKKALAFKLAYIDAFNCMERDLATKAQKGSAQISHETIGSAQAQHIKELVQQVVQATGQGYGEVWGRLHSKFCVNSYLSLSATQFDDVCKHLSAKLQPQGKRQPGDTLTEEEVKAFRAMVQGESLDATLARLTHQVTQGNGYPISMFIPLWEAINRRLTTRTRSVDFQA